MAHPFTSLPLGKENETIASTSNEAITGNGIGGDALTHAIEKATTHAEWNGELIMPGILLGSSRNIVLPFPQGENIIQYLHTNYRGMRVAFDSEKYPIGEEDGAFANDGWKKLSHDLIESAHAQGFVIRQANTLGKRNKTVTMTCDRQRHYDMSKSVHRARSSTDYRAQTYNADNKNSRGPLGKHEARRSITTKATEKDQCCPFKFNIRIH
jgi:hypothetical protein